MTYDFASTVCVGESERQKDRDQERQDKRADAERGREGQEELSLWEALNIPLIPKDSANTAQLPPSPYMTRPRACRARDPRETRPSPHSSPKDTAVQKAQSLPQRPESSHICTQYTHLHTGRSILICTHMYTHTHIYVRKYPQANTFEN